MIGVREIDRFLEQWQMDARAGGADRILHFGSKVAEERLKGWIVAVAYLPLVPLKFKVATLVLKNIEEKEFGHLKILGLIC